MIKFTINAVAKEDPRLTRVLGDIRIVQACRYGVAFLVITPQARAIDLASAKCPICSRK